MELIHDFRAMSLSDLTLYYEDLLDYSEQFAYSGDEVSFNEFWDHVEAVESYLEKYI